MANRSAFFFCSANSADIFSMSTGAPNLVMATWASIFSEGGDESPSAGWFSTYKTAKVNANTEAMVANSFFIAWIITLRSMLCNRLFPNLPKSFS